MKYIDIEFKGNNKLVPFLPELNEINQFKTTVSHITSIPTDQLIIEFQDLEHDTMQIVDQHDLYYFEEQDPCSVVGKIYVKQKEQNSSNDLEKSRETLEDLLSHDGDKEEFLELQK